MSGLEISDASAPEQSVDGATYNDISVNFGGEMKKFKDPIEYVLSAKDEKTGQSWWFIAAQWIAGLLGLAYLVYIQLR